MKFITTTQEVTRTEEVISVSREYCCDQIKEFFRFSVQPNYLMSSPFILADDRGISWARYEIVTIEWEMIKKQFNFCPFCGSKIEFLSNRP